MATKWIILIAIVVVGLGVGLGVELTRGGGPQDAAPTIFYSQSEFYFTISGSQTLYVWNSGSGRLNWSVGDDVDWLTLSPTSGTSTGGHDAVTVSVDTSGLSPGTYNATITITACCPNPTNSPQHVPVNLTINPHDTLSVHFIDVGQGDSILIDYGTYEMLIDGGRYDDCAVYISSYIDGPLEVMVATHPDADHIGGLDDVLDAFVVEHIWVNGDTATTSTYVDFMAAVSAEGAQVHQAQRGDHISLSTLTFDVLHPAILLSSDKNENSIVLLLSFGQVDFLFTGDAESGAESSMLAAGLISDIDIIKVAHHGSKYSSTASFLAAAQPEIAIYSAGAGNPYGHPAPETITRLHDAGATVYGTDVHGDIVVTTDGTTYYLQTEHLVGPV